MTLTMWVRQWLWKSVTIKNADVGFKLLQEEKKPGNKRAESDGMGNIGSCSFIDSSFSNVGTAVVIAPLSDKTGSGSTGVVLENVRFDGVGKGVADSAGKTILDGGSSKRVEAWATGPIYAPNREFSMGKDAPKYRREISLLDGSGAYLERARPQYEGRSSGDFVHLKELGAKGKTPLP